MSKFEAARRARRMDTTGDLFAAEAQDSASPAQTATLAPAPAVILAKTNFTEEQSQIIHSKLEGITKIHAYAGTGKTYSLVNFAKANPKLKGLYLAFNKAIQLEGARKFPSSVLCRTSHSIAYQYFGQKYKHKLKFDLRLTEVINLLGMGYDYPMAILIKNTIAGYCVSAEREFPNRAIAPDHEPVGPEMRLQYAAILAKQLWTMMCDVKHPAPMLPDGYLKLFQLSGITLSFDYILFDEAQDSNPVTTSIIRAQRCPILVVGDPYQSIYAFRGATNALEAFTANQQYYLTQSFRFGPVIAELATDLLHNFYGETRPVIGSGFATEMVKSIDPSERSAVICRTNAEVFSRAVLALSHSFGGFAFVGGVNSYGFSKILDAYHLFNNEAALIHDAFIKSYTSFAALSMYADESHDLEAKRLVAVVMNYTHDIPSLIQAIQDRTIDDLQHAHWIFSTAHKSKGLDLEHVVLADDFKAITKNYVPILDRDILPAQEINLTYVSLTRAVKKIQLNSSMENFRLSCCF